MSTIHARGAAVQDSENSVYKMHEKDSEDSEDKMHEGWEMEDRRWESGLGAIAGSLMSYRIESRNWDNLQKVSSTWKEMAHKNQDATRLAFGDLR